MASQNQRRRGERLAPSCEGDVEVGAEMAACI